VKRWIVHKRRVHLARQMKLARRAAAESRRRLARNAAAEDFQQRGTRAFSSKSRKAVRYFPAPEEIDLSENYEATVKFLMQFRRWTSSARRASSFYVDLRPVRRLTPAGALLLAAEFHRWKIVHSRRLRARDAAEWDLGVRSLLGNMGFFELLAVDRDLLPVDAPQPQSGVIYLPFECGKDTDGRPFVKLRDLIEATVGRLRQRLVLYQAVSEAITNVRHHAYERSNNLSRWWMSASIDTIGMKLKVLVLDHGLGIPTTLPRKGVLEKILSYLEISSLRGFSDDGRMIDAAVTLGRSAVRVSHRGHGLKRDIQHAIRTFDGMARLRIHSNRGKYMFSRDFSGHESTSTASLKHSLDGTFVEWTFELKQLELNLK
jgi:hypothetical protein